MHRFLFQIFQKTLSFKVLIVTFGWKSRKSGNHVSQPSKNNKYIGILLLLRNCKTSVFATPLVTFQDFLMVISWFSAEMLLKSCSWLSFFDTFRARFSTSARKAAKTLHKPICFKFFLSSADRHRRTLKTCSWLSFLDHFWRRFSNISMPKPLWIFARI